MPKILICPLGHAPGVVTGTLDALHDEGVRVDKVILLWLQHPDDGKMNILPATVRILQEEFRTHYTNISLDLDSGHLILEDVKNKESNNSFYQCAANVIQAAVAQPQAQVFVSVSGGRKTMAALTFAAAYLYGADDIEVCHIAVEDEIDEIGRPEAWQGDQSLRATALHPPKEKRTLIRLPPPNEIQDYRAHPQANPSRPVIR